MVLIYFNFMEFYICGMEFYAVPSKIDLYHSWLNCILILQHTQGSNTIEKNS